MDEELKKTLKNLISNPLFELDCLLNEPSEDFLWFIAERSLEFINNSSDEGYKLSLFVFYSLEDSYWWGFRTLDEHIKKLKDAVEEVCSTQLTF